MSGVPPANIVTGIVQTAVAQKQSADKKNLEEKQRLSQSREQATLSDQQETQVEDTLETEETIVRRHDEEESHQQQQHKHRTLPEDEQDSSNTEPLSTSEHIDLQA